MEERLLEWFARHGRDLPWRRTRDPYAILVSEVMLQQTQVSRVAPRYEQWLARWPTVEALAATSTADVIRAWQGLGYNRRAVNLQRAARHVAAHGWPDDLTELPGVGPYTAAAIANFAFGRPVLPIDVNVGRVLERTGATFQPHAAQALFDLGATICLGRRPRCHRCPLAAAEVSSRGVTPLFQVTMLTSHSGVYPACPGTTSTMLYWPLTPFVTVQRSAVLFPGFSLIGPKSRYSIVCPR